VLRTKRSFPSIVVTETVPPPPAPRRFGRDPLDALLTLAPAARMSAELRSAFQGGVTPSAIHHVGLRLGLELTAHESGLRGLERSDLPVLVVFEDGSALPLLAMPRRGRFLPAGEGVDIVDRARLIAGRPAAVYRVRRADPGSPATGVQDASPRSVPIEALLCILRRRPGSFARLVVAAIAGNLLLLAVPVFSMAVYDRVLPHLAMETLWALAAGAGLALAADLTLRIVRLHLGDAAGAAAAVHVKALLMRRLLFSVPGKAPRRSGPLLQALREVERFCMGLPEGLVAAFVDLPFLIVLLVLLASISPAVAAVACCGALVVGCLQAAACILAETRSAPAAREARRQADLLDETLDALAAVKLLGLEPHRLAHWERLADSVVFEAHRARFWSGFSAQTSLIGSQAITVAVMIAAVHEIAASVMTVGALAASTMLVARIVAPLSRIATGLHGLSRNRAALEPVRLVLELPQERAGDASPAGERRFLGAVELVDVRLDAAAGRAPILHPVALRFDPGERIAIVGRIGSGKTSLLRLIAGLVEPSGGVLAYDRIDARLWDPRALRRGIGLMTQETALFDGTLYGNLVPAGTVALPGSFARIAALTGVDEIAARRPDGFETRVGPRGEDLSGGERQTVLLARTLAADPSVLLLDEPTAAMDTEFETRIIGALREWLGPSTAPTGSADAPPPKTLIVATHRLSLLELVDRVIWLDGGRVVADGPKSVVLAGMIAK
jgi:ATP-binding cassette subfamily C protein LapB